MNGDLPIALHLLGFLTSRDGEPLTFELMAGTHGTSPVVLRRVLADLQRAGLVETWREANSGSALARDPEAIDLRQAYEAVAIDPGFLSRHPECAGRVEGALAKSMNTVMGDAEPQSSSRDSRHHPGGTMNTTSDARVDCYPAVAGSADPDGAEHGQSMIRERRLVGAINVAGAVGWAAA